MENYVEARWAEEIVDCDHVEALSPLLRRGYGVIPKLVMTDHSLSYKAKCIYAYLCTFANNEQAVPSRDTILAQLNLGTASYYNHQQALLKAEYIFVEKVGSRKIKVGKDYLSPVHNIYVLNDKPPSLEEHLKKQATRPISTKSHVRSKTIRGTGYGLLSREVMKNPEISMAAKAIYAYLCSFEGAGDFAKTSLKIMLYHINMSSKTFYTAMQELVKANYVEVVQDYSKNGQFSVPHYYIVDDPDPKRGAEQFELRRQQRKSKQLENTEESNILSSEISDISKNISNLPSGKNQDISKAVVAEAVDPSGKNQDITFKSHNSSNLILSSIDQPSGKNTNGKKPYSINPNDKNPNGTNPDAFINSSFINSSLINSLSILSEFDELDNDKERKEFLIENVFAYYADGSPACSEEDLWLMDIILHASHKQYINVQGVAVPRAQYMERALELDKFDYEYIISAVLERQSKIRNKLAYVLSCIYTAHEDRERKEAEDILADGLPLN